MLVDPFTIVAQVVNFVILAVALRYLLYDRVIAAMDEREQGIAARIEEAERREEEAEHEAEEYRERRQDLDAQRDDRLAEADREARERLDALLEEARVTVERRERRWEQALARQRAELLAELQRRTGEQVCAISRRVLEDLADADLQRRVVDVALRRLRDEPARLDELLSATADGDLTVRSAFRLADDERDAVVSLLADRGRTRDARVSFEETEELVCGVELHGGGRALGWSVDAHLASITERIEALLPVEEGEERAETATDADGSGDEDATRAARHEGGSHDGGDGR